MHTLQVRALYFVFFLSGFCGLIYESIWSHYLKLVVGHAAYAQAVVLVVFVGGMALGAWLASLFTQRLRHPILVYAAAEAAVAALAFGFHAVFVGASGWALDWLLPATCTATPCWSNWLLAAALILPGATLLGSTFPLMSAGILRLGVPTGRGLSWLYFLNSAGAALGVLASGFVFIPNVGLPGALLLAGSLNAVVALGAWLAVRTRPSPGKPAELPVASQAGAAHWLLLIACITGLSSFIYEVVWIRMLTLVLGAATHSFELMLASFIFGLALGGWWVRDRIDKLVHPERTLALVQVAMGVLAVATLPLYSWCFDAMAYTLQGVARTPQGYNFHIVVSAVLAMAVILPATFCAGMTLPLLTHVLLKRGGGERQIGRAYSANTLGAIVGVLVTVYWLMPEAGLKWTLAIGALLDILLGAIILWHFRGPGVRRWALPAVATAMGVTAAVPLLVPLGAQQLASGVFRTGLPQVGSRENPLFHSDGRTASITVLEHSGGSRSLLTNGKPDGSTFITGDRVTDDDRTVVMLGALGPAHHPQARRAAVVGLGTGITASVLLQSGQLESVETIEIEPMVVEAGSYFRPRNAAAFEDPRSRIVIDDARAYLARSTAKYDLIVSEPSNPWVSGVSGLFTREFYDRVAQRLADKGHFVQWLHLYEASPELVSSIITAFSTAFPEYKVYASNQADIVLVARADGGRVELAPDAFASPGLAREFSRIGIHNAQQLAGYESGHSGMVQLLAHSYGAPANSDYFPFVDNRAASDRFKGTSAHGMFQTHLSPVPYLEFGQPPRPYRGAIRSADPAMPRRLNDLASAWHGSRLLHGEHLSAAERAYLGRYEIHYELVRNWLWGCQPVPTPSMWDSAVGVAGELNTGLSDSQASALWQAVLTGPCAQRFTPEQRLWLALFQAVGKRDAVRVRDTADRLRAAAVPTPTQQEYLLLAAAGARISLGEHAQAREIYSKAEPQLAAIQRDTPWFRYMRAVLSARPVSTP